MGFGVQRILIDSDARTVRPFDLFINNWEYGIRFVMKNEKEEKGENRLNKKKIHFHCISFCVEFYLWRLFLPFTCYSMFNEERKKKWMLKWTAWQIKIIRMMQWRHAVFFYFFHFFFFQSSSIEWKCSVWSSSLCVEIQVFFFSFLFNSHFFK